MGGDCLRPSIAREHQKQQQKKCNNNNNVALATSKKDRMNEDCVRQNENSGGDDDERSQALPGHVSMLFQPECKRNNTFNENFHPIRPKNGWKRKF